MKLKLDEAGHAVLQDGKPVYVHDDGKEIAFDVVATVATIGRLNGEAKSHRERAEAAEGKLKAFDGIDDAAAARKALETVKNLDSKKLVDAGQIETVKAEAIKAVEEKYAPIVTERDKLRSDLYAEKIGGAFSRSKFIADKIAIPADMVQARFGSAFDVKDGKTIAKDAAGNPIFSRARPGEHADFDEALEILVDAYPQKDHILKGTGAKGDGARPGNGAGAGSKVLTRKDFEALPPTTKAAKMAEGYTLTD